jgi:hypothetical protein
LENTSVGCLGLGCCRTLLIDGGGLITRIHTHHAVAIRDIKYTMRAK